MAVAAIIAMRHHEAQIEAAMEDERNKGGFLPNEDIYDELAEDILRKKKETPFSHAMDRVKEMVFGKKEKKRKKKVYPVDENGNPVAGDDDSSIANETRESIEDGPPADYYVNPEYWPNLIYPAKLYLQICYACYQELEEGNRFNNMVTITIIIAGINVGVQTYPGMDTNFYIGILDWAILGIFTVEIVVKILMEGFRPWMFLVGRDWAWNNFDTAIVMLSFPFWGLEGGSSIALLRLVRLARLGKLIKKIPALQMIVQGLMGGLSSITYIMILLFLVFYLYGVVGFYLFSANDPFHFGTLMLSMLTLFRCATLENWGDIMFLNLFGCDVYTDMYVGPEDETPFNSELWCRYPGTSWALGPVYFISFIVVAAMVMLSLFIGAVTISMTESMIELKSMQEKAKAQAAVEQNMKRMQRIMKKQNKQPRQYAQRSNSNNIEGGNDMMNSEDIEEDDDDDDDDPNSIKGLRQMALKYPMFSWWYYYLIRTLQKEEEHAFEVQQKISVALRVAVGIEKKDEPEESEDQKMKRLAQEASVSAFGRCYLTIAAFCHVITNSDVFSNLMTSIILLASVNVGLQTEKRIVQYDTAVDVLDMADVVILIFFTAEVVLKVIAEGLHPLHYFSDSWNVFDFIIVVGSYIPGAGSSVTMLRLLRLLRVLKLVKRLPQLAVIINALLNGMVSIAYVGLVLVLFFYVFSIIGMLLFAENDPWHFGSLHMAFLSLFQAATLDDWTILMYVSQYGCHEYGGVYEDFPEQCVAPKAHGMLAVMYFLIFIIVGAQVLLSLFIGVISTSMDEAQEEQKAEQELNNRIEKTSKRLMLTEDRVEAMKFVFEQLDLDGGGTISEDELKLGLDAINAQMSEEDIVNILQKVSADGTEVDVNGFILFLYETPLFAKSSSLAKISNAFISTDKNRDNNRKKKKKNNIVVQFISDLIYYGGTAKRIKYDQLEAVLVIQDTWRERSKARKEKQIAKKQIEYDQRQALERRRSIQASMSGKRG
jgi:voltage-gated sodium channel